jgi:hypothetical protein
MGTTLFALYNNFDTADGIVEALLDLGIPHTDIQLMSGHSWQKITGSSVKHVGWQWQPIDGSEIILEVRAEGEAASQARELVCNSGPIEVQEREGIERDEPVYVTAYSAALFQIIK